MPIRISGMNSGLDTEALVSDLVSAYRAKGDKYVKEQTKVTWKKDAWKSLSSQTYSFRNSLDSLRFTSAYTLKNTSVSNSAKASVTASNNTVNGTQTLKIKKLAKSGYLTGGEIKTTDNKDVASTTTMAQLGLTSEGAFSVNGKRITVNSTTKVSDVITKLKDAGVDANFDATNQRIFVSAKESGKEGDFALTALNEMGAKALSTLGLHVQPEATDKTFQQYVDSYGAMNDSQLASMLASYDTGAKDADRVISSFAKEYKAASDAYTKETIVQEMKEFLSYAENVQSKTAAEMGYNDDAVRIYGQNAEITLNGAEFTSKTNAFSINGLTINALAETDEKEELTITTTTDNQGIYDKIKDFLADYNELINAMTKSYNADSAADYDPLTDEEKETMSEKEVEKWEEKGKGGVLRRDTTLNTLMSVMTTAMSKTYSIDGKNYALSSFGIKTLGIMNAAKNEQNAFHIDGDADDEKTSGNTDKLMKAITEDPDAVMEFFQKLSSELYDSLGKQMSSTTMRSYGSFYNDKELDNEYKDYTTTISEWEDKVADIEERYYKKFAAMESALGTLQNQTSQLSGLLGM